MTNLALKEELATLDREDVSFGLGFCLFCPTTDNLSFRLSNVNPCVFFFFLLGCIYHMRQARSSVSD